MVLSADVSYGVDAASGHLAPRADLAIKAPLPYFQAFMNALARPWTPEDIEGSIAITVAENKLSLDLLQERLSHVSTVFPAEVFCYSDMRGIPRFKLALAGMLAHTFMKGMPVEPAHLSVSAGCGAVLDNLFQNLCSEGDGVIIPAPYYPAFDNDLQVKVGAVPIPVHLDFTADLAAQLSASAAAAAAAGHPVKALLVTNPNNPVGTIDSEAVRLAMLDWCLDNKVHLVSDEIYGNSIWGEGASFRSVAVLSHERQQAEQDGAPAAARGRPEELLHVVMGLSKDFGSSGLRVGALWSRNEPLNAAMGNLGYFQASSNMVQWLLSQVLEDLPWLDTYLATNQQRMRDSYKGLADALDAASIPHVPACAAMFCWIDLRAGLVPRNGGWAAEEDLWNALVAVGVVVSPGSVCHAKEAGFFRMCWSWVHPGALPVAVERIRKVLEARKQQD